jgi:hypothetical protein
MFVNGSGWNEQSLSRTFHRCFLPSFDSFGQVVSEEKIFFKSANQKQELPVTAMFVNGSGWNEQSLSRTFHRCFLPSFDSFGQAVSEKIFKNRPIRNKNCLWRPCLLTDRDEISNLYTFHRCFLSSFGSFDQAVAEEKIFKNRPIRNKNCLWWPCLLIDRDKMSTFQVSVHLAERFQRRRLKCEKLTVDGRRTPSDGKNSHCHFIQCTCLRSHN